MNRDKPDNNTISLPPLNIFRGLFSRVARRLGVDPSFVSRVARGERNSPAVREALDEEMHTIRQHLNNHHENSMNGNSAKGQATKTPSGPRKRH